MRLVSKFAEVDFCGISHNYVTLDILVLLYVRAGPVLVKMLEDSLNVLIPTYCNRRKKKVYAWTVDDEISMQKMLFEHVDAVVTSNPTLFQRVMQNMRTECLEEGFSLSS